MNQKSQQKQNIQNSSQITQGCLITYIILAIISAIILATMPYEGLQTRLIVFTVASIGILFVLMIMGSITSTDKKEWLETHGQIVQAIVINSYSASSPGSYGGYGEYIGTITYYLELQWKNQQTGITYTFTTSSASSTILLPTGSYVPVLIDPDDPTFYRIKV
jgi:hypothetical protein